MTARKVTPFPKSQSDETEASKDGRRQRSERSRKQIIDALFSLIRGGEMAPSAAQVAEIAGVSLRTVFRHFEDMESLNREMAAEIEEEIIPIVLRPLEAQTWRARLEELVARRIEIYERIMPIRVAASIRRFQSDFLMDDYNRFLIVERESLKAILPAEIADDHTVFSGLEVTVSFQVWRRLRQDQDLDPSAARDVVHRMIHGLLIHQ